MLDAFVFIKIALYVTIRLHVFHLRNIHIHMDYSDKETPKTMQNTTMQLIQDS